MVIGSFDMGKVPGSVRSTVLFAASPVSGVPVLPDGLLEEHAVNRKTIIITKDVTLNARFDFINTS
jgi:hypothetical protein